VKGGETLRATGLSTNGKRAIKECVLFKGNLQMLAPNLEQEKAFYTGEKKKRSKRGMCEVGRYDTKLSAWSYPQINCRSGNDRMTLTFGGRPPFQGT